MMHTLSAVESTQCENSEKKKAKNQNKVIGSVSGKKLKKFLNFIVGAADDESLNVAAGAPPSPPDTEEESSFEFVEKTRETKAVPASGRRANEFYLSKIQALEKVLVEMRKKKRKRKGQQSQECSEAPLKTEMESAELPVTYPEECVMNFVTSYFSLSSNSSGIDGSNNSGNSSGNDDNVLESLNGFRPIPLELEKNNETVLKDILATAVENKESILSVTCVEPQEDMNYFRSRFFRQDALQRSNPLNSAENVLRSLNSTNSSHSVHGQFVKDYRHRRRHRKDLTKIIDVTNDDLDGDEVSDNDGDASNDVIEPVMLPTSNTPAEGHAPVVGHAQGNKTPERSNSFRRRNNVSSDLTEPVMIPTSHSLSKGHAPVAGHTPLVGHAHGSKTPEKSNSFQRRKNEKTCVKRKCEEVTEDASSTAPIAPVAPAATAVVQIEVTVPMEQVSLHPSTKTGSISCKTECVTSQSDQSQSIIPRPEVVPAKAIETALAPETEEEEEDPLSFIQIKSAAQWMAVSKRISWNFEETETEEVVKEEPFAAAVVAAKDLNLESQPPIKTPPTRTPVLPIQPLMTAIPHIKAEATDLLPVQDYENVQYDIYCPEYDGSVLEFNPTKEKQLRLICWKVKPWKQPKASYGQPRLFTSAFGAGWGVDCDEVYPGLFIGDKASASNVAFLKRYGITHVLNAAEGIEEGLVDLNPDHYAGTGISYMGFPLWDAPGCNLMPYLGIAADYIKSAIDCTGNGKCLVNCQMGVSRSASCAMAYLMIHKSMTAVEGLTLFRKSRDCRPNDGFLTQLIHLDNELRLEREHCRPRKLCLSTLKDRHRLPLSWHNEFWMPNQVTEEELGFVLVPMKHCATPAQPNLKKSPSIKSTKSSRSSSKRNSFRAGLCSDRLSKISNSNSLSRSSSMKRSRPASISVQSDDADWEWVWDTDTEDDGIDDIPEPEMSLPDVSLLDVGRPTAFVEQLNEIITRPEEKWRKRIHYGSESSGSNRSSFNMQKGTLSAQMGVEDNDPLSMVKVVSAKQWKNISRKLTINFDDLEEAPADNITTSATATTTTTPTPGPDPDPGSGSAPNSFITDVKDQSTLEIDMNNYPIPAISSTALQNCKERQSHLQEVEQNFPPDMDYHSAMNPGSNKQTSKQVISTDSWRPQTPLEFKPTTVQELRRLCWQIKPWDQQPRKTFAERQLFTSILATNWGCDADEVHPRILVGDQAAAKNIPFLKRFGITHVLNAAEGPWPEHCVNLTPEYYEGSGITYLGLPLWDCTNVNILPYLGCAAEFIKNAMRDGQKCLVNCQMGVSRSCSAAMAYLMIYEGMGAVEILRTFRKRRDVRPNDYFLEQIVELDNDLRKQRECDLPRRINFYTLGELDKLAKPWHFEFWSDIPDDLPFSLTYLNPVIPKLEASKNSSKRTSMISNESSEWEWEYYSQSSEDYEEFAEDPEE